MASHGTGRIVTSYLSQELAARRYSKLLTLVKQYVTIVRKPSELEQNYFSVTVQLS